MMTIAEMYKRSGGADRLHECSQCANFIQPDKKSRVRTCGLHPERPEVWKADWMACRYFRNSNPEKEAQEKENIVPSSAIEEEAARASEWGSLGEHQMTIEEFIKSLT